MPSLRLIVCAQTLSYLFYSIGFAMSAPAFASGTRSQGPSTAVGCEQYLENQPREGQILQLTPELARSVGPTERELLDAVAGVLSKTDDERWLNLSQSLIENPKPLEASVIAANPFYLRYPKSRTSYGDVSFTILATEMGDVYSPYELGLLSAVWPPVERVRPFETLIQSMNPDQLSKLQINFMNKLLLLLKDEDYRPATLGLLHRLGDDAISSGGLLAYNNSLGSTEERLTPLDIRNLIDRLSRGRFNRRDLLYSSYFDEELVRLVSNNDPAGKTPRSERKGFFRVKGLAEYGYTRRDWFAPNAEIFFASHFTELAPVSTLSAIAGVMVTSDPVPMPKARLKQLVLSNLNSLLFPVRELYKRSQSPNNRANTGAPAPRDLKPFKFEAQDHFEPRPHKVRTKLRAVNSATAPIPASTPRHQLSLDPSKDLRQFSAFVARPRPLTELTARETYEFEYLRAHQRQKMILQISQEARDWLVDNPIQGSQTINALHLGRTRGELNGIKFLGSGLSNRYAGPIYEVKIHGKFRPLLIRSRDTWQILKVSHKDDIDHDCKFLAPLED